MHLSITALQQLLSTWGYIAVFAFVAAESTGIPFPGETMLVTAGAYAGSGHLQIPFVIAAAALGAISGDNLGYLVGRTGGREFVLRYGKYVRLTQDKLSRAEKFFARYGEKTVFFGRFVAILRAWTAFLAGLNHMDWRKFFAFNAAGGICWALLYGLLAFVLGHNLPLLDRIVKTVGYVGLGLAAAVVIGYVLFKRFHRKHADPIEANGSASSPAGQDAPRTYPFHTLPPTRAERDRGYNHPSFTPPGESI